MAFAAFSSQQRTRSASGAKPTGWSTMDVFEFVEKEVERLSLEEERELRKLNLTREKFAFMLKELLEAAKEKKDRQKIISAILSKYTN